MAGGNAEKLETDGYFSSWGEASKMQADGGRSDASKREVGADGKISYSLLGGKIRPSAQFSADGTFKSSSSKTFEDRDSVSVRIPVRLNGNSLTLSWNKSASETGESADEDYSADARSLCEKLAGKKWFLKSAPIHDLFSEKIGSEVSKRAENSDRASYSSAYGAAWKRQFSGTKSDFFVPNAAQVSFSRDITKAASESDLYQFLAKAGTNAFNMFGKSGLYAFFDWYEQDEFSTSISFAAKIPRGNAGEATFLASGYTQATFYIRDGDYLKNGLELSFEDADNWSAKGTAVWKTS